jgi:hypothetical protein
MINALVAPALPDPLPEIQAKIPPVLQVVTPPEPRAKMPPVLQAKTPPELRAKMPHVLRAETLPELQAKMLPRLQAVTWQHSKIATTTHVHNTYLTPN